MGKQHLLIQVLRALTVEWAKYAFYSIVALSAAVLLVVVAVAAVVPVITYFIVSLFQKPKPVQAEKKKSFGWRDLVEKGVNSYAKS